MWNWKVLIPITLAFAITAFPGLCEMLMDADIYDDDRIKEDKYKRIWESSTYILVDHYNTMFILHIPKLI